MVKKNTIYQYINDKIKMINSSKVFAGLVVITLNIASRFVDLKLSKSVETYLKYNLSRNILIFCIIWMGSRDTYISIITTFIFTIFMDYLFHEESVFCVLPEQFTVKEKKVV